MATNHNNQGSFQVMEYMFLPVMPSILQFLFNVDAPVSGMFPRYCPENLENAPRHAGGDVAWAETPCGSRARRQRFVNETVILSSRTRES